MFKSSILKTTKMSELRNISTEKNRIVIKPLTAKPNMNLPIFINKKNKIKLLHPENSNEVLLKSLKMTESARSVYKEDIIYESKPGDFIAGNPQYCIKITNRLNLLTNCSRTFATYTADGTGEVVIEKTSDSVTKLIGQQGYDIVFSALCSVISQELKIRGMLALMTVQKKFEDSFSQTEDTSIKEEKIFEEKYCQTEETCMDLFKPKQRKRIKRNQLTPYVVKDPPPAKVSKRVVIYPETSCTRQIIEAKDNGIKYELTEVDVDVKSDKESLPDLKHCFTEDSNGSFGNLSSFSASNENLLDNPKEILKEIEQHTSNNNPTFITMPDGTQIKVTIKPEDFFHIATPQILKGLLNEEKMKLLWYQAYIDWKFCQQRDEDGNLPLHNAVLFNDVDLLRRQCLVLKNRNTSLDIPASNMTALQMSLFQDTVHCMAILLQYGADPLHTDEEQRTLLHLAGESSGEHLGVMIRHCQNKARDILKDHTDLWSPALENKSNEELGQYLLANMCTMIDSQGYTPLMVASKAGIPAHVRLLVQAAPNTVNMAMPNCGNTALYLAVGAACLDAGNRGNKSKVTENFSETVKILMSHGADPSMVNHSGSTVNELLTEFNIAELSQIVANSLTKLPEECAGRRIGSYMLVMEKDGKVNVADMGDATNKKNLKGNTVIINDKTLITKDKTVITKDKTAVTKDKNAIANKTVTEKNKPVILENIALPKIAVTTALRNLAPKSAQDFKIVSPNEKLGINIAYSSQGVSVKSNVNVIDTSNKSNVNVIDTSNIPSTSKIPSLTVHSLYIAKTKVDPVIVKNETLGQKRQSTASINQPAKKRGKNQPIQTNIQKKNVELNNDHTNPRHTVQPTEKVSLKTFRQLKNRGADKKIST